MNSASNLHSTSLSSKTVDKTVDKQVDKPVGKKRSRSVVRRKESDVIVLDDSDTQPMKRHAVPQSAIVTPDESPESTPVMELIENSVVNDIPYESPETKPTVESRAVDVTPHEPPMSRPTWEPIENSAVYIICRTCRYL